MLVSLAVQLREEIAEAQVSRARDAHERELLRSARGAKPQYADGKTCGNPSCSELGRVLPLEYFYVRRGRPDSYCVGCRRASSAMYKIMNPEKRKSEKRVATVTVPACATHGGPAQLCGCADGIYHKTPKHRARIAKSMQGNRNARGKKNDHGPLSAEHRLKISMAMRGRKWSAARRKKMGRGK